MNNIEKYAYLSQMPYYRTGCGYSMDDWLKARDMLRAKNSELIKMRDRLMEDKVALTRARKRYINK
jgi:hypothetical protein